MAGCRAATKGINVSRLYLCSVPICVRAGKHTFEYDLKSLNWLRWMASEADKSLAKQDTSVTINQTKHSAAVLLRYVLWMPVFMYGICVWDVSV